MAKPEKTPLSEEMRTEEGMAKFEYLGAAFLKQRLRDFSFSNKLLPGLQVDFETIIANGISMGIWGGGEQRISEAKLQDHNFDILRFMEKDVQRIAHQKDRLFLDYADAAVKETGNHLHSTIPPVSVSPSFTFTEEIKRLDEPIKDANLKPYVYLMSDTAFSLLYPKGFTGNHINDRLFVRTSSDGEYGLLDKWETGNLLEMNIYMFVCPLDLGDQHLWGDIHLETSWEMNVFKYNTWQRGSLGIRCARGVAKMTFTSEKGQ